MDKYEGDCKVPVSNAIGELLIGERNTISGWYSSLEQDGPIIVVYLPNRPQRHEPYNSLLYSIRT